MASRFPESGIDRGCCPEIRQKCDRQNLGWPAGSAEHALDRLHSAPVVARLTKTLQNLFVNFNITKRISGRWHKPTIGTKSKLGRKFWVGRSKNMRTCKIAINAWYIWMEICQNFWYALSTVRIQKAGKKDLCVNIRTKILCWAICLSRGPDKVD